MDVLVNLKYVYQMSFVPTAVGILNTGIVINCYFLCKLCDDVKCMCGGAKDKFALVHNKVTKLKNNNNVFLIKAVFLIEHDFPKTCVLSLQCFGVFGGSLDAGLQERSASLDSITERAFISTFTPANLYKTPAGHVHLNQEV